MGKDIFKIGYFADGPWSHDAFHKIIQDDSMDLIFIVPRYDNQDSYLKKMAKEKKIPFLPIKNINITESLDILKAYEADIYVSMSFNQIFKKDIIGIPPHGIINCHAGALPFYRGRNPLNWVLINDEKEFGITVHYVDEGIDTGDIISQEMYTITNEDTYATLLSKAFDECGKVLYSSIKKIMHGSNDLFKQSSIHPVGSYFGRRRDGDEKIDFSWSSRRIYNFVRAITAPGPCARFFINSSEYALVKCKEIKEAPFYIATIGEVLGKNNEGIIIKTGDSLILITEVAEVTNGVLSKPFKPVFNIGTRLN